MTTFNNDSLNNELGSEFVKRNDLMLRWGLTVSSFQAIPGLVGFWPMSSIGHDNGVAYDLSGQARNLSYNGNPFYRIHNALVPYIDFDGTGDYLSRATEGGLELTGSGAYGTPGLTMGGWFWEDVQSANRGLIGKWTDTGNQRSYLMGSNSGSLVGAISSNGTGTITVTHSIALATGAWNFLAYRYIPSTVLSVYHLSAISSSAEHNVTSIPATIFSSSTAALQIGAYNAGTQNMNGRASLCFLSACGLSASYIMMLFNQSRTLFGI